MEIFIVILSTFLLILGIAGSFLPVLPGPLLSWLGLFTLNYSNNYEISTSKLVLLLVFTLFITIADYIIPSKTTKKFGGSKYAATGTTIGLILGFIIPIPGGMLTGLLLGAFIGEMINSNNSSLALKASLGSLVGFLASSFMKMLFSVFCLGISIWKTIELILS